MLTNGLPHPHNIEAYARCSAVIRKHGAVPAAMAVIDGVLWCGLDDTHVERLSRGPGIKLGARDLAIAIAKGQTGGTTMSATAVMAVSAGARVVSTGGMGGVHRGVSEELDISQDLPTVSRHSVAVVCAGAKSVLDLPKTLEFLETLGVPVVGVGTNEMPAFYSRESGLTLAHSVADASEAARVLSARLELELGGIIFALPPPQATAIAHGEIEQYIDEALIDARKQSMAAKQVTPFVHAELIRRTDGRSLKANLALLENNADFAAELAVLVAA